MDLARDSDLALDLALDLDLDLDLPLGLALDMDLDMGLALGLPLDMDLDMGLPLDLPLHMGVPLGLSLHMGLPLDPPPDMALLQVGTIRIIQVHKLTVDQRELAICLDQATVERTVLLIQRVPATAGATTPSSHAQ